MSWFKTLVGGVVGFMVGGPLGAILGASLASQFQGKLNFEQIRIDANEGSQQVQMAFFVATFSVMGHIAKLNGRVHTEAISLAKQVMNELNLDDTLRATAISLFRQGKKSDFHLQPVLAQFYRTCQYHPLWLERFLRIQMQTAVADGMLSEDEERVLLNIAAQLHISRFTYERIKIQLFTQQRFYTTPPRSSSSSLAEAYKTLGLSSNANMADVKQAYRRLMNQHHPDKLAARGLSDTEMNLAKEKTQAISKAYEIIQKHQKTL